jgi:hypothetical protein
MAQILATKTSPSDRDLVGTFAAVRAEALFASTLQSCGSASPAQVRRAVAMRLRQLGSAGVRRGWPASSAIIRTLRWPGWRGRWRRFAPSIQRRR